MKVSGSLPALAVLALLVTVAFLCATHDGLVGPHTEASDECCSLAHCSVVTIDRAGLTPWVVIVALGVTEAATARSTAPPPVSPPPELPLSRSA